LKKSRLDELLLRSGLCDDLEESRRLIGAGEVSIQGTCVDKAGVSFPDNSILAVKSTCPYVSRGGYKLEGGLRDLQYNPEGFVCVDIGASTGGFTDCLLQHGARKVYAVDVAYGMLDWKLRQDPRVVVIERFNARKLTTEQIPEPINLAVIDAAFISLTKLIPPLLPLFNGEISIICLIKPQFELPRKLIPKGGVVINTTDQRQTIEKIFSFINQLGLNHSAAFTSSILGSKGNKEYLIHITGNATIILQDDP